MTSPVDSADSARPDGDAATVSGRATAADGASEGRDGHGPGEAGPSAPSTSPPTPSTSPPTEDRARARATAAELAATICPYLSSAGGSWRMATPSRDHRCLGLTPPTPQPNDKQRRHCLSPDHVDCAIFQAARAARLTALAGGHDQDRISAADARRRPIPRTAPILLEPPRLVDRASRLQLDRAPGQLALVGLMVVAFVVVALSRLSSAPGTAGEPSPTPSLVAILPSASVPPASILPSASASDVLPSASPSIAPSASPSFRTLYTVKKGDTLVLVASRYKTTVAAIKALNNLKTSTLHIGQVLKIP